MPPSDGRLRPVSVGNGVLVRARTHQFCEFCRWNADSLQLELFVYPDEAFKKTTPVQSVSGDFVVEWNIWIFQVEQKLLGLKNQTIADQMAAVFRVFFTLFLKNSVEY